MKEGSLSDYDALTPKGYPYPPPSIRADSVNILYNVSR